MEIFTIGFTQKSAKTFFEAICQSQADILVDIRLNNSSQLAGFSKGHDLEYFLDKLCGCRYVHDLQLAPDKRTMDDFRAGNITWHEFRDRLIDSMNRRGAIDGFVKTHGHERKICLLCSEVHAKDCHRTIVAELIAEKLPGTTITHLE